MILLRHTLIEFQPLVAQIRAAHVLIADIANVRNYSLAIGIAALAGGVLLLLHHKRQLDTALSSDESERAKAFETRKFRRRALASALIASLGSMMSALFWVNDQRVFVSLILIILGLLMGITVLAMFDLFSVGLQQLSKTDEPSQKAMIEEFLRKREESKKESENPE